MIVFRNAGEIDIRSISTFGVSVKEGNTPIGFFGTGLKYAIAVLLRKKHKVTIYSGVTEIEFGTQQSDVRGQSFDFVTMRIGEAEPLELGFTTELGKQWETWMAFREIACNCRDESGESFFVTQKDEFSPCANQTHIVVVGNEFESIFANAGEYLLDDRPDFVIGNIEVRARVGNAFFYRGVRVQQFSNDGMYTYNTTASLDLTEDRTVKYQHQTLWRIAGAVMQCSDKSFIRSVLTAGERTLEHYLDFDGIGTSPGKTFLEVCGDLACDRAMTMNKTALKVWQDSERRSFTPREITMTKVQQISMTKALDFCERLGFPVRESYPIKVVESLGGQTLGLAHDQTIFIVERVFQIGGAKQLASTLIEEYLHLRHGWRDMSRELQSYLFEKLVSVGEELFGEPL